MVVQGCSIVKGNDCSKMATYSSVGMKGLDDQFFKSYNARMWNE